VIEAEVDASDLVAHFDEVARRAPERIARIFSSLRAPMRRDQREHADREEGPDGARWPARSPRTAEKVRIIRRAGRQKGQRTFRYTKIEGLLGTLPELTTVGVQRAAVFARPPSRMTFLAEVHTWGAIAGRGSVIPARPYIYVSDELARFALAKIADGVLEARKGL
jgi:phage gpG-like protein